MTNVLHFVPVMTDRSFGRWIVRLAITIIIIIIVMIYRYLMLSVRYIARTVSRVLFLIVTIVTYGTFDIIVLSITY